VTRQCHYQLRKVRERQAVKADLVVSWVRQQRALQPRLGARKLHHMFKMAGEGLGLELGRDRFIEVLRAHALLVSPKPKRMRTTYRDPALPVYRNLLYHLEPTAAHQVWVSDITYVETAEGYLYLSLITDRVSRQIVGWNAGESLNATESIKALHMAIEQLPPGRWPIHHSDRGSQYCCHEYVAVLNERHLPISMTEANHCYENSVAERVNGILKSEYNLDAQFRNKAQARRAIEQAIFLYNQYRPHEALALRTPAQVHRQAA
jgi:transposase InsO family protein